MVIGHEYMGYIEKMGAGVTNLKIGERVTGEGHLACGHCRNCRRGKEHVCENTVGIGVNIDGSFAEYVKVPAKMLSLLITEFLMNGLQLWILLEMLHIQHYRFP